MTCREIQPSMSDDYLQKSTFIWRQLQSRWCYAFALTYRQCINIHVMHKLHNAHPCTPAYLLWWSSHLECGLYQLSFFLDYSSSTCIVDKQWLSKYFIYRISVWVGITLSIYIIYSALNSNKDFRMINFSKLLTLYSLTITLIFLSPNTQGGL